MSLDDDVAPQHLAVEIAVKVKLLATIPNVLGSAVKDQLVVDLEQLRRLPAFHCEGL